MSKKYLYKCDLCERDFENWSNGLPRDWVEFTFKYENYTRTGECCGSCKEMFDGTRKTWHRLFEPIRKSTPARNADKEER